MTRPGSLHRRGRRAYRSIDVPVTAPSLARGRRPRVHGGAQYPCTVAGFEPL